ncbi:hypothetical protein QUF07_01335 [Lentilactobacillus sp. TOM.63]|uniref:hypothetical protein n=1 Tax=Lentilactobacillus sp. TOM.63 TaxID=3055077 RepID=UPI0025A1E26D|nr:hypothetical protein [Lentilactobacillus sp. TOM.63]MDM7515353.1 hypothetical protein [Lentilactobacillus sp. TOM.63]
MFIDMLLTNPERRQLQLIEAIRSQRRVEFTELSKLLKWPYVSTQQVYRRLVTNYQAITGKKISKQALVDQCDWIDRVLTQTLVRNSVAYRCLLAAIREQPKPLLPVGNTTILTRLTPFVKWLADHNLTYNMRTNEIQGDERLIRIFGWQLCELGNEDLKLTADEDNYLQALAKSVPAKVKQSHAVTRFLQVTAIRLSKYKYLTQESQPSPKSNRNELMRFTSLPAKSRNIQFNLAEVYWLQYMVTYSPYFVDTHITKLVRPKERAVLPYLIQLVVKTVITRLQVYRSPLYFEELDEYLMGSIQFAILLKQPPIKLNEPDEVEAIPELKHIVAVLTKDIPELTQFADEMTQVLSRYLAPFISQKHVEVSYPNKLDDYVIGVLQQRLMTRFMSIDWQLRRLPISTEVTTPLFQIVVSPANPAKNQYYWLPWLSIENNVKLLLEKIGRWLQSVVWVTSSAKVPVVK